MGISSGVMSGISGISSLVGGLFNGFNQKSVGQQNATAATNAAGAQVNSAQQGIGTIQGIEGQQQANSQPFIGAGQQSLQQIMTSLSNGTFGQGSTGAAPVYGGGTFSAPTAEQAAATPGYQFTQQQGSKGILQGAAAAGGAISGGTLKALSGYNTGLADSTYNDTFNRSMGTYNAGLQQYQAQLQGYGAKLQGQQQEFNQAFAPVGVGATAAGQYNNTLTTQGENLANLFNDQGTATASGILGANKALQAGNAAGTNSIVNAFSPQNLSGIMGMFGGGVSNGSGISTGGTGFGIAPPNWMQQLGGGGGVVPPPRVGPSPNSGGFDPMTGNFPG